MITRSEEPLGGLEMQIPKDDGKVPEEGKRGWDSK